MSKSDPRDALSDIVYNLKSIFGRYDRTARRKAWDALEKPAGQKLVRGLVTNPERPIVGLPKLLSFKEWLETYQQTFPFMQEEDPPDAKKINRFKTQQSYVKSAARGGRQTEVAAEKLISAPVSSWFVGQEEIVEIVPNALTIPSFTYPNGTVRPEWHIAFVVVRGTKPANPNQPKYNKRRYRVLAFWQGRESNFSKEDLDQYTKPLGGLAAIGGYIDTVWVDPEWRGNRPDIQIPSVYAALREFAKKIGLPSLEPGDELTSTSFRTAQAKYDWKRAKASPSPSP